MRSSSRLRALLPCLVTLAGCGGTVRDYANTNLGPESPSTTDAGASTDARDVADAVVDTAPPACGCCGAPFAARLPDFVGAVLTTPASDVVVSGNVLVPPGTGAGALTLARIGDGGSIIWRREYEGERGMLLSLVESRTGGFALLRSPGTSTAGGQLVATDSNGALLWSKALGVGKSNFSAVSVAATRLGFVVVGTFAQTTSPFAYSAWLARISADGTLIGEEVEPALSRWDRVVTSPRGDLAMCGTTNDWTVLCTVQREDGAVAWRKTMSLPWVPHLLAFTGDGELLIAGTSGAIDDSWIGVAKLDALGERRWIKYFSWSKTGRLTPSSLVATAEDGFAIHGSFTIANPSGPYYGHWYAARGDRDGATSWIRGYSFTEPKQSAGVGVAACKDGLVLVGHSALPETVSWIVRTDDKGYAPIPAPGAALDP